MVSRLSLLSAGLKTRLYKCSADPLGSAKPSALPKCSADPSGSAKPSGQFTFHGRISGRDGNRHVKVNRVDDAVLLKLYPDSIRSRPGKNDFEFDFGATVGQKRMLVHHVDE